MTKYYYNTLQTPILKSDFHKALFNGRLNKINELINSGDANIYETNNMDQSSLFMAIARDHTDIAHRLIDIYEDDVKQVKEYFESRNVGEDLFWIQQKILIAFGNEHIEFVKDLSSEMEIIDAIAFREHHKNGLIILLKSTSLAKPEIKWLSPNKIGDDKIIAKIVEKIYANGWIEISGEDYKLLTVLDICAKRNYEEIFFRLLNIYDGCKFFKPNDFVQYFCQFATHKNQDVQLNYFQELVNKLNRFTIAETVAPSQSYIFNMLKYTMDNDEINIFEYLMDAAIDTQISNGLASNITEGFENIIINIPLDTHQTNNYFQSTDRRYNFFAHLFYFSNCAHFVIKCLKYKPSKDLFLYDPDKYARIGEGSTLLEGLIRYYKSEELIANYIIENYQEIVDNNLINRIYIELIQNGAECQLNKLYESIPEAKNLFIVNKDHIAYMFKIDSQIKMEFKNFIQTTHNHIFEPQPVVESPFIHQESFLESKIKGTYNNFAHLIPNVLSEQTLEIIESSDDEIETKRKEEFNRRAIEAFVPDGPNALPMTELELEADPLSKEFVNLIAKGADFKTLNKQGQNLLFSAVEKDNLYIVKELLKLGLNPNAPDNNGNKCIFYVRSIGVYRELLKHLPKDVLLEVNNFGKTILHIFVSRVNNNPELLTEIIVDGAQFNAKDNNGKMPLHSFIGNTLISSDLAKVLLDHGADINALDNNGETPISLAPSADFLKVYFSNPNIDLYAIGRQVEGKSYIDNLLYLNDRIFTEVLPNLAQRNLDQYLVEFGNKRDKYGNAYIYRALDINSNKYCLNKLLAIDNLDILNPSGENTILFSAIGNVQAVKRLIALGADVNANQNGMTPLLLSLRDYSHFEDSYTHINTLRVLLEAGANTEVKNGNNETALEIVVDLKNNKNMVYSLAALIQAGVKYLFDANSGHKKLMPLQTTIFNCLYEFRYEESGI